MPQITDTSLPARMAKYGAKSCLAHVERDLQACRMHSVAVVQ